MRLQGVANFAFGPKRAGLGAGCHAPRKETVGLNAWEMESLGRFHGIHASRMGTVL